MKVRLRPLAFIFTYAETYRDVATQGQGYEGNHSPLYRSSSASKQIKWLGNAEAATTTTEKHALGDLVSLLATYRRSKMDCASHLFPNLTLMHLTVESKTLWTLAGKAIWCMYPKFSSSATEKI